jgi:hypothetical protein
MITTLICIWAAVTAAVYSIEFARLHLRIGWAGYHPFNRKPFNCEVCLPWWLFAVFFPVAIYHWIGLAAVLFVGGACTAGIIAPIFVKLIRK